MSIDPAGIDPRELRTLLGAERWFAGKDRSLGGLRVVGVPATAEGVALAVVEVAYDDRSIEHYQLALAVDGAVATDALARPDLVAALCALCGVSTPGCDVRPVGVEQSNSSVVVDGRHVLKLFRRLEPGRNPEVELLGALGEQGFTGVPRLEGALDTSSPFETTLVALTAFVPSAGDGWNLTLDSLADDPGWLPARARRLGTVTAELHAALAAEPSLGPTRPEGGELEALAREISDGLATLPAEPLGGESRVRELRGLAVALGSMQLSIRLARLHGDLHLGQALWADRDDWVLIDLEGEPGRSLAERRRPRPVARDIAGMTRSFAYVSDGVPLLRGSEPPSGWLDACRSAFVDGYLGAADPRLVPESRDGLERMIALFELERLVYELRYELQNRPDWVSIPLAGVRRWGLSRGLSLRD